MKNLVKYLMIALVLGFGLVACEPDDPVAEDAGAVGDVVDDPIDAAGDDNVVDDPVDDPVDAVGDDDVVDDPVDDTVDDSNQ